MQRRWLAGMVYASGFMIGFGWFIVRALKIIINFYRIAFDPDFVAETPDVAAMFPPLVITLVFISPTYSMSALLRQTRQDVWKTLRPSA